MGYTADLDIGGNVVGMKSVVVAGDYSNDGHNTNYVGGRNISSLKKLTGLYADMTNGSGNKAIVCIKY